jgi:hypothetical protein
MYRPYVIFTFFAALFGGLGAIPFARYAVLEVIDAHPGGHLQSLLVGTVLLIMAFLSVIIGVISDLIRTNRTLIEDGLEHTKKVRFAELSTANLVVLDDRPRQHLIAVADSGQAR